METFLDVLAGAGPAVVALALVLLLVWRQFCALQDGIVKIVKDQTQATTEQAASNRRVAEAVDGLQAYMERRDASQASYQEGMREFAKTMTTLATSVERNQGETLRELREHREATEAGAKKKAHPRPA